MRQQITILLLALIFFACRQSSLTQGQREIIINEVRQTLGDYYDDIRKSGLMAEFKYLDDSPEFFWVPPGYTSAISFDSVATVLKQAAPKYRSIDNSFDTLQIIPLSKDLATYTGRLRSTMTDTSGKSLTFSMVETGILIRRANGWKLLSGQTAIVSQ